VRGILEDDSSNKLRVNRLDIPPDVGGFEYFDAFS
jgi:hypothetical protein